MTKQRNHYVDLLRAGSLLVVVGWHWFATILIWAPDGPHATSPLASVPGLWLGTWVLQVMPVFFYVGGYLHRRSYRSGFIARRVTGLATATAPLLIGWVLAAAAMAVVGGLTWAKGTMLFALSPLWFLVVYLGLVVLLPLWTWLDRRFGLAALPILAVVAAAVDVLRLGFGVPYVGWLNLIVVWGLAHQAGFHHDRLLAAPRRIGYLLVGAGIAGLVGLLALGYPGSMVGVPGDTWSNMSPPTLAIVALSSVQIGLIRLGHPAIPRLLAKPAAQHALRFANRYGMPIFLFHMTAFLLAQAVGWPYAILVLVILIATTRPTSRRRPARQPVHPDREPARVSWRPV